MKRITLIIIICLVFIIVLTLLLYKGFKSKHIGDYFDYVESNNYTIILKDGNTGDEHIINDKILINQTFNNLKSIKLSLQLFKAPSGGYKYNFIVKKNGANIFNMYILNNTSVKINGNLYNTSESVLQKITNLESK